MKGKPIFVSLDIILTGQRIHSVIKDSGYSIRQIQEMLSLSCPQPVYRWIHGSALPSVDNLYRLSKIFQIHMEDLLVEVDTGDKMDQSE